MNKHNYSGMEKAELALNALCIYRNLLADDVISSLNTLIKYINKSEIKLNNAIEYYSDFFHKLSKSSPTLSLPSYIVSKILFDENPFSLGCERTSIETIEPFLLKSATNDLVCLQTVASIIPQEIKSSILKNCSYDFESEIVHNLPIWHSHTNLTPLSENCYSPSNAIMKAFSNSNSWGDCINVLAQFHNQHGCGMFAHYKAFIWNSFGSLPHLQGVEIPDPIKLSDLVDYEAERLDVINNTLKFINGCPANNVLLYGDRGTGKSSTVKAILNEYHELGLRIIEVPKRHLMDFPRIISELKHRNLKFIIFIDDLSFEDADENYTALKAILEGGVESKPSNVLIYATSNRRHLIKEKFSDRAGLQSSNHDDEVRAADTIQEKLSLADRFGITVVFSSPNKRKYLEIVEGIALKRGINIEKEVLHREALKWELWYNGRSPRTARQFVDWLEGQITVNRS
ncbi:MAG: ATP-binding protein [Clostridia bacterium]|nr:ATP-binding protein [Clostridia bacterium]